MEVPRVPTPSGVTIQQETMNNKAKALEVLKKTTFVRLIRVHTSDPTLIYVQPIEKDYWLRSWECEKAVKKCARKHKNPKGPPPETKVDYVDLKLGLLAYVFDEDKLLRAQVTDIKGNRVVQLVDIKTRKTMTTQQKNVFKLGELEGFCDDKAILVQLGKLKALAGMGFLHEAHNSTSFMDPTIFEIQLMSDDDSKFPCCDLISMLGRSYSLGLLKTVRDNNIESENVPLRMCLNILRSNSTD